MKKVFILRHVFFYLWEKIEINFGHPNYEISRLSWLTMITYRREFSLEFMKNWFEHKVQREKRENFLRLSANEIFISRWWVLRKASIFIRINFSFDFNTKTRNTTLSLALSLSSDKEICLSIDMVFITFSIKVAKIRTKIKLILIRSNSFVRKIFISSTRKILHQPWSPSVSTLPRLPVTLINDGLEDKEYDLSQVNRICGLR